MSVPSHSAPTTLEGPPLGPVLPNIATLLERNAERYPDIVVFRELKEGIFVGPTWREFLETVRTAAWWLKELGLQAGDRCAIVSPNRLAMLQFELAVMASGGVAVPIFHGYPRQVLTELISFCEARFLALGGVSQLDRIDPALDLERIIIFDDVGIRRSAAQIPWSALCSGPRDSRFALALDADPDATCLMQYTSGTTGKPKLVQLSHRNILSQRTALDPIWSDQEGGRLLSYLPWHHSFGGIFELFNGLARGATITLEPSYGKDPISIVESWKVVRPTAFFSVPKVYQSLMDLTRTDPGARKAILHPALSFVFTAAAPLPDLVAREFDAHGARIIEGWGLTETAPCCTIAGIATRRRPGVVGLPIPGVRIRIADDGEIQVRGPNVMKGYYNNDEANALAFTPDGWFRTGDVGAIEPQGLRLIGRGDRIFKLSNGEKVVSSEVEQILQGACHYLTFAIVEGSGRSFPVALLFPNRDLLAGAPDISGCICPRSLPELSRCLHGCLGEANASIVQKFARIRYAVLVDADLSIEGGTLTPSMKVVAGNVADMYRATIEGLYEIDGPTSEDVYVVTFAQKNEE